MNDADRKRRGEPIANLWVNPETLEFEVDSCNHPIDELIPVYEAPQPAEPLSLPLACGSCGYTADPECLTCSPQPAEPVNTDTAGYMNGPVSDGGMDPRHTPVEPVKVPSDDEIMSVATLHETHGDAWQDAEYRFTEADFLAAARALLARYGQATHPSIPPAKDDPWFEEGVSDVVVHAQRQAYVDGWNACREAIGADCKRLVMEYNRLDKEWADLRKAQIEADRKRRGEPAAKVRDRGFEVVDGKHVPTVLVEFPVDAWESRDRFAAAVDAPQPAEPEEFAEALLARYGRRL